MIRFYDLDDRCVRLVRQEEIREIKDKLDRDGQKALIRVGADWVRIAESATDIIQAIENDLFQERGQRP